MLGFLVRLITKYKGSASDEFANEIGFAKNRMWVLLDPIFFYNSRVFYQAQYISGFESIMLLKH